MYAILSISPRALRRPETMDVETNLVSLELIGRVAPAVTRARSSGGSERYYVGRRPQGTEAFVVSSTRVEPLEHPAYQSSAAFDWGKRTPGALELAFALLAHSTDSRPPDSICRAFWTDVVACFDRAGFVLGDGDIALWLLTAFCEHGGSDEHPPHEAPRGFRRAMSWLRSRARRR